MYKNNDAIKVAMLSLTHGHTRKYYQTLKSNPNLELVAVYAETKEVEDVFLKYEFNVPCYSDIEDLFKHHPEIEAVIMASANDEHLKQFKICTERGIHILCMKIPTFNLAEYDEMIHLVEKSGVVCQVELELHYNPVVERIKEMIREGTLGKIYSLSMTNVTLSPVWAFPWQGIPEKSYGCKAALTPGDSRYRGGSLADHPHVFDLIRHFTGSEIDSVFGEVGINIREELQVEDNLLINGRMKNGIDFIFNPSWSMLEERLKVPGPGWEVSPKRMEVNIVISGQNGVLMADCFGPNVYFTGAPNSRYTIQYTYFDEWIGLIDEFVDCIRFHKEPQINLRWHRNTIKAMNACYDSIYSGETVSLSQ